MDHANPSSETETIKNNLGFIPAFVASLSVIIVSELGDKTFFIAAIMAMRHPRATVFVGAIAALALMTVLSGKYIIYIVLSSVIHALVS
jgi:putative Ca2+/H+ antiporter (TMEM165/GDT1 family)